LTHKNTDSSRGFSRSLLYLAAGVAIGLMAAPKTGRGSRAWVGQKFDHLKSSGSDVGPFVRKKIDYQQGRLAGVVHEMRKRTGAVSEIGAFVDDDLISQRVRTSIGETRGTAHLPRINVDTANGVVTLRGVVDTGVEKEALTKVASAVEDVEGVVNKVTIAPGRAAQS
jgi:hypothetical protein